MKMPWLWRVLIKQLILPVRNLKGRILLNVSMQQHLRLHLMRAAWVRCKTAPYALHRTVYRSASFLEVKSIGNNHCKNAVFKKYRLL